MRTLHVAALPFPSPQGTQALLLQVLRALGALGHDTHLLCYAHGVTSEPLHAQPFAIHRVRARSTTDSLRSGPSLDKLRLDASLAAELVRLTKSLAPDLIVAHHVEAATCALFAERRATNVPFVFVAHTSLAHELPSYLGSAWSSAAPLVSHVGRRFERSLVRRASHTFAVSPLLATLLAEDSGCAVHTLPLPWPVERLPTARDVVSARASLGYELSDEVALYAGNLDAYQGLDAMLPALANLATARPSLRLLIATESDPQALRPLLRQLHLTRRTQFVPLAGEAARRRVHAAADLALIPRRCAGGVPIKLLDALARGLPCVAARLALAGFPFEPYCEVVDHQPYAWELAMTRVLSRPDTARLRAQSGRAHVQSTMRPELLVAALVNQAPNRERS